MFRLYGTWNPPVFSLRVHVRIEARFYNIRQLFGLIIPINRPGCIIKFSKRFELRSVLEDSIPTMYLLKDGQVLAKFTSDYDFYSELSLLCDIPVHEQYKHCSQVAPAILHPSIREPLYFNFSNPMGMVAGFCKRVCHQVTYDYNEMKLFRQFVQRFIHKNYKPLPYLEMNHENLDSIWLEGSHYNLRQKEAFHEALERFLTIGQDKDFYHCKAFMKKEPYGEYKYPRIINSRSDQFKAVVAPLIHLIEERVCVNDHTIKHKEKHQFVDRMQQILNNYGQVYETDYSSFEGSYSKEFMMSCEYQLLSYMLSNNQRVKRVVTHVYKNDNQCFWKGGYVRLPGSRMSGEMWTSSMNGFTNRMLFEYTCWRNAQEQGCPISYDFIVEGDDGLLATSRAIDLSYVSKLGFKLKIDRADDINDLSFCGINICDGKYVPDVARTLQNITYSLDPGTASSVRRRKQMIYARGLSLMVESSGIPILQDLAIQLIGLGSKLKYRDIDWWCAHNLFDSEDFSMSSLKFINKYKRPISDRMRHFVAKKYNIPVASQLRIEKEIHKVKLDEILEGRSVILCY